MCRRRVRVCATRQNRRTEGSRRGMRVCLCEDQRPVVQARGISPAGAPERSLGQRPRREAKSRCVSQPRRGAIEEPGATPQAQCDVASARGNAPGGACLGRCPRLLSGAPAGLEQADRSHNRSLGPALAQAFRPGADGRNLRLGALAPGEITQGAEAPTRQAPRGPRPEGLG